MSFFRALAHAFGFGGDDGVDDDAPSAFVAPYHKPETTQESADTQSEPSVPAESPAASADDAPVFPLTFFDGILEVFNNAQPDFIKACLDREAQRRYLYDTLGASFSAFLAERRNDMAHECESRLGQVHGHLREEIASLKEQLKNAEEKATKAGDKVLSADRRQRALNDKVKEMDLRIRELEAEREQYELENKSLLNKLKVAEVLEADRAAAVEEGNASTEEINSLRTQANQSNFVITQLKAEVEKLKKENEENAEIYKSRMQMSDKMLSDIRNSNNRSGEAVKELQTRVEELEASLATKTAENEKLAADLAEATASLPTAEDVMRKVEEFETVLGKRDERIRNLKEERDRLQKRVEELEYPVVNVTAEPEPVMSEKARRKRKTRPKISAIDETIDGTEWLVAAPPEKPAKNITPAADPDFGYQEPPKKSSPVNDAQMSLF